MNEPFICFINIYNDIAFILFIEFVLFVKKYKIAFTNFKDIVFLFNKSTKFADIPYKSKLVSNNLSLV